MSLSSLEGTEIGIGSSTNQPTRFSTIDFDSIDFDDRIGEFGTPDVIDLQTNGVLVKIWTDDERFGGGPFDVKYTFSGIAENESIRVIDAELVDFFTDTEIPPSNVSFDDSSVSLIFGNISVAGPGYGIQMSFEFRGTGEADWLQGASGDDRLTGRGGEDILSGGFGSDTLKGGSGDDRLDGGARADRVVGNGGNDTLDGGSGSDTLTGGSGNDVLDGGAGRDRLTGGGGEDVFVLAPGSGRDTVRDFDPDADMLLITTGAESLDDVNVTILANAVRVSDSGGALTLRGLSSDAFSDAFIDFG